MFFRSVTLLFLCFLSVIVFGQSSQLLAAADKAYAEKDYLTAINLYKKYDKPLSATQTFNMGQCYAFWGNDLEALEWFNLAVDRGSVPAMRRIADIFLKGGRGFDPDKKEAFVWYQLAAAKEDVEAIYWMGVCYRMGHGTAVDYKKAADWYKKAAEKGSNEAMKDLALLLMSGKGVPKDVPAGFALLEKVARTGDKIATLTLGIYYYEGIMGTVPDYTKAMYWLKKAVDEHNHTSSMLYIGDMYQGGKGVAKDNQEAYNWYKKAADKGSGEGMNALGAFYLKGMGVAQNYFKAFDWFKLSAERDFAKGMYNLAYMYENGLGTGKDLSSALQWYKMAANKKYNATEAIQRVEKMLQ